MRATLITGERTTSVIDVPEPEAGPGRAVVDVALCGVCGTDVHAFRHGGPYAPFLCGHEWFGTVVEIGPGVSDLAVGQRAVLGAPRTCGTCRMCRAGHSHRCEAMFSLFRGARHGGYAPRVGVAADALVPLLDDLSDVEAAQIEPATVALHAVRRRPPRLGDVVVVIGAGPIGLCVLQHARLAGAWRVAVVEPRERRRSLAAALGADVALGPGEELTAAVLDLTGGLGADLVYDAAGSAASLTAAMALARPGGAVMMVGVSPGEAAIDPGAWLAKELTVDSSLAHYHEEFAITMRLVADGRLQLEPLHARTVALADLDEALTALADGGDDVKVLVDPR